MNVDAEGVLACLVLSDSLRDGGGWLGVYSLIDSGAPPLVVRAAYDAWAEAHQDMRLAIARAEARCDLEAAQAALLDAAAEVASIWSPDIPFVRPASLEAALAALYRANDAWQEAQLRASEVEP